MRYAASVLARRRWALGAFLFAGCFVDLPADTPIPDACLGLSCSADGFCDDGVCLCQSNFVGNPYALHGCQPIGALSPCDTTCGLNAYCEAAACRCADGFVAVCGTGDCVATRMLCDGTPDCANAADEDPYVCHDGAVQTWSFVDACGDDDDIQWRVWSQDREWVWPNVEGTFTSVGQGGETREPIECLVGETMCFGGESSDGTIWGIGLDGRGACDDCCHPCSGDPVDLGELDCE